MRQYLQRLLSGRYQVEAVSDGRAALDAVRRAMPDLILSDVMMPRLDGFGLLREIRADPQLCGLPVILLSARAGEEDRVEGMQAVADDYLVKPFGARTAGPCVGPPANGPAAAGVRAGRATDEHHTLQEFRASVGAPWPFLSDPGRIVQRDLDIQEYTDPEHDPMIPHTLVLKPGLVVHRVYNGYWFWGRPSVVDLWHDLRDVSREIRPDWDLSTPGLREAWDAGDHSAFHGWNRRAAVGSG